MTSDQLPSCTMDDFNERNAFLKKFRQQAQSRSVSNDIDQDDPSDILEQSSPPATRSLHEATSQNFPAIIAKLECQLKESNEEKEQLKKKISEYCSMLDAYQEEMERYLSSPPGIHTGHSVWHRMPPLDHTPGSRNSSISHRQGSSPMERTSSFTTPVSLVHSTAPKTLQVAVPTVNQFTAEYHNTKDYKQVRLNYTFHWH